MKKPIQSLFVFLSTTVLLVVTACGQTPTATAVVPTSPPTQTSIPTTAPTLQPVDSQRSLTVNGLERTFLLHIPAGLASDSAVPLVFVFHGLGEAANLIQQASGMNAIADANGFIVVYPNGSGLSSGLSWNAGKCCGYALQNNVDETAFVRQIISDVGTLAKVDLKRVYASGFSNGGLLSYRLACDMAETFAAVAPVAGVLVYDQCQPNQPVALIDFHGLSDNVVPAAGGGVIPDFGQPFPPVGESITTWAKLDGCTGLPQTEETSIFTHTTYASCKQNSAVELYSVKGIGHSWPSQYIVPATQMIWDFFKAHPKP